MTDALTNDYQKEQLAAYLLVRRHLRSLNSRDRSALQEAITPYLHFRRTLDRFLGRHLEAVCTAACYQDQRSACCSKDGIITFFADHVINALCSEADPLAALEARLQRANRTGKCVYLTPQGCCWTVRPLVCAMFLCDRSQATAFGESPEVIERWRAFELAAKRFRWPDRPVLFDALERIFIDAGHRSSLMYLHNSPGLLRVKQRAGLPLLSVGP